MTSIADWKGVPFVFRCQTDGERGGLLWPAFSGTGCPVSDAIFSKKWLMYGYCFCICPPPKVFLSTDFLFQKRIRLIATGLLYIRFTY